jgi:hypothetical protein
MLKIVLNVIIILIINNKVAISQNFRFIGDTVNFELRGNEMGKIQWQASTDLKNWVDIIGANNKNQNIILENKSHFRASIIYCEDTLFSDTTSFSIYNKPLRIGVFGGSISSTPESQAAKEIWLDSLGRDNFSLTTLGVSGAGFSSVTENSIPNQIRIAKPLDVYILWASTNDLWYYSIKIGEVNSQDTTTQNGGINLSIKLIKKKNQNALIIFLTSLPIFYVSHILDQYVEGQKKVCIYHNISFLDQYNLYGFNSENYLQYYKVDAVHLKTEGYLHIGPVQAKYIKEKIFKFKNY